MKNIDVIRGFLHRCCGQGSNLYSDGRVLVNYRTPIAAWIDGTLHVVVRKYSVTTSKNQGYIVRLCKELRIEYKECETLHYV